MKNTVIISLLLGCLFFSYQSYSQGIEDIKKEAESRNITTKEEGLALLAEKGISESQAREMARLRGMDFDELMENFIKNNPSKNKELDTLKSKTKPFFKRFTDSLQIDSIPEKNFTKNPLEEKEIDTIAAKYFGYNIFNNNPFANKEYLVGNIDENYILAPGDELRITVFGANSLNLVTTIDLNGNITIPNMGVFSAAGNSYATLKDRLTTFLGRYFSGLLTRPQRTFLDISLTQIRPVQITVLGQVKTPGPHLVNGLASVLNALYASGGINISGSLRDIKVYRNNKLIKTIDLYDFITQGNIASDARLANNDIIFIAPRLSSVSLSGTVKEEKIFELKPDETLQELFNFSGKLPINASISNINITRVTPFKNREQTQLFDKFMTSVDASKDPKALSSFKLFDGDSVAVSSILNRVLNKVNVTGNVHQPGTYALGLYPDLKSLINQGAKQVLPNTYMDKVDIYREDNLGEKSFKTFNLSTILQGDVAVPLQDNDSVAVYSLEEITGKKIVSISGFVEAPKTVFWRANYSLFDLIFQTVSLEDAEYKTQLLSSRVDLKRYDAQTGQYQTFQFSLDNLTQLQATYLAPKDEVVLYSKEVSESLNPTIQVLGYVNTPGEIPLGKEMYVEDALLAAGGFVEFAQQDLVYINRLELNSKSEKYSELSIYKPDLQYLLGITKTPENPFVLEPYDIISVVKPKDFGEVKKIYVNGEVNFPRAVVMEKETVSINSVLQQVGGITKNANLKASYILREDKKAAININDALDSKTQVLKAGDVLTIASNIDNVYTAGNIGQGNIFSWEDGRRAKYYINQSGGTKEKTGRKYVIQNNGKIQKIGFLKNPKIYPGAKIVVEKKPETEKTDGKFIDDFIRILSVVTGVFTTIILSKQL